MKKKQIYEAVVTDRVDFQDKAKVRVVNAPDPEDNGTIITVKNAIPGQHIEFRLKKQGKGDLVSVKARSSYETQEVCPVFGRCGGCTYSSMDHEVQLKIKRDMVQRLLDRAFEAPESGETQELSEKGTCMSADPGISGVRMPQLEKICPSPKLKAYRNKMEYSFGDSVKDGPLTLGLHRRGSRFDVLNADECILVHEDFNKIVRATRDFFEERNVPYFHKMEGKGFLRHLVLRRSEDSEEILVNLVTASSSVPGGSDNRDLQQSDSAADTDVIGEQLRSYAEMIKSLPLEGKLTGIIHTVNDSVADVVKNEGITLLYGQDFITEKLLGLEFKITPFSFFQTNSKGAEVLYSTAREYALSGFDKKANDAEEPDGKDKPVIFDLYSGTGTIAQIMAPVAKKVIGVEIVEEAVEAARENAKLNGLENCEFIAGDVLKGLDDIEEKPDFIILDPPRDGVNPKALAKILDYGVDNILYISCKPTSLARDLVICAGAGYEVVKACCVDMFPGTGHVETCCLLERLRNAKDHVAFTLDMEDYYRIKDAEADKEKR